MSPSVPYPPESLAPAAVNDLTSSRTAPADALDRAQRCLEQGRRREAIFWLERCLAAAPSAALHNNLGALYREEGDSRLALSHCRRALILKPDLRPAACNMGQALLDLGRIAEAVAHLRHVVFLAPDFVDAWLILAHGLQCQGRLDAARAAYETAAGLNPAEAAAFNGLGVVYKEMGRLDLAEANFRRALERNPALAGACNNLGNVLSRQGRAAAALACYDRAIAIAPDFAEPHDNLLAPLLESCAWDRLTRVLNRFRALQRRPRPGNAAPLPESPLVSLLLHDDPGRHREVARAWAAPAARAAALGGLGFSFSGRRPAAGPLTVGYLSANFNRHPVAFQLGGLFRCHDRQGFRTVAYALGPDDGSDIRRRIAAGCDRFVDIGGLGHAAAARRIHDDGVDILVDLMGHTRGNRLEITAHRPAPVVVSYLGFLGTSGADFIDYLIADPVVVPAERAGDYTEALVHLPHCYQVNDDRLEISAAPVTRAECHLPAVGTVFCSFNNPAKIDPVIFDAWMTILRRVEGSVLWLQGGNPLAVENLRRAAMDRGIDPQRLVFAATLPLAEHLARLKLAHLALDTRCYNGGATTSNALWAGVPVIAMPGRSFVSRMSASALAAVGLSELICPDPETYICLAVDLAKNPRRLSAVRWHLAENRRSAPLFDTARFTRNLESAYREMWRIYRRGERPRMIRVTERKGGMDEHGLAHRTDTDIFW